MNIIENTAQNIFNRLAWNTAKRDQAGVARELAEGNDVHEIYGLGEAGLLDEFFYFLDEFGIKDLFNKLKPKRRGRESPISFQAVILIYFMRIVAGLAFFSHIETVLLHSQSLMRLVGFNGRQIKEGSSQRGLHRRSEDQRTAVRGQGNRK